MQRAPLDLQTIAGVTPLSLSCLAMERMPKPFTSVRRKNGFEITNTLQHNRTFHFCICLHIYVDINIFLAQKRTFTHNLDIPMLEIQTRPSILFVLFNASLSLCNSSVAKLFCLSRWLPYGPGILAQQLPTTRTMTGRCMQWYQPTVQMISKKNARPWFQLPGPRYTIWTRNASANKTCFWYWMRLWKEHSIVHAAYTCWKKDCHNQTMVCTLILHHNWLCDPTGFKPHHVVRVG